MKKTKEYKRKTTQTNGERRHVKIRHRRKGKKKKAPRILSEGATCTDRMKVKLLR